MKFEMKRTFLLLLVLLLSYPAFAQKTFEVDGITYRILKDADESTLFGTVAVTGSSNLQYSGTIIIPNAVKTNGSGYEDNFKVTDIDAFAFKGCTSLVEVIIPISIESIGTSAFEGCTNLISVDIKYGSNLSSIGECLFKDSGIESINLRGNMTTLPRMTFMNCKKLKEVTLSESIRSIGVSAFLNCSALKTIQLPSSLSEIQTSAFASSGLEAIILPTNITVIPLYAFQMCKGLAIVELSQHTTKIESGAFMGDYTLHKINKPITLTSIADDAFWGCCKAPDCYISSENRALYDKLVSSGVFNQ